MFAGAVVGLRFLVVPAWITAALAVTWWLPGLGSGEPLPLGGLIPENAESAQVAQRDAELFGVPLTTDTLVVQRNADGLSPAAQAKAVARAVAVSRAPKQAEGIQLALPIANTLGLFPSSREHGTTAITYLYFGPEASLSDRVAEAEAYASQIPAADAPVGVTGPAPARDQQFREIEDALPIVEAGTVLVILLVVGLTFQAFGAPLLTLFAAAIEFEVDGRKVIATGDQQDGRWVAGERPEFLNYEYRNGFRFDDFRDSAELYRRLRPDLLISGHWLPRPVTDDYLDHLLEAGTELARLHRELLPWDSADFGAGGFAVRIEPYRSQVRPGEIVEAEVVVRNPLGRSDDACVSIVVPPGWIADPSERRIRLPDREETRLRFRVRVGAKAVRRARIAADLTVGDVRFGQQAEALVTVR